MKLRLILVPVLLVLIFAFLSITKFTASLRSGVLLELIGIILTILFIDWYIRKRESFHYAKAAIIAPYMHLRYAYLPIKPNYYNEQQFTTLLHKYIENNQHDVSSISKDNVNKLMDYLQQHHVSDLSNQAAIIRATIRSQSKIMDTSMITSTDAVYDYALKLENALTTEHINVEHAVKTYLDLVVYIEELGKYIIPLRKES